MDKWWAKQQRRKKINKIVSIAIDVSIIIISFYFLIRIVGGR